MMKGKYGIAFFAVLGILFGLGCSTKRNTPATRAWHELTTRYNIYFNAEAAYNEILNQLYDTHEDHYDELLPMYPNSPALGDTAVKTQPGGPFDGVIEKMETAIREHSIAAKPRRDPSRPNTQEYRDWLRQNEFNPFIHEAWLLMGKAHVGNNDYAEAVSVLSHTARLFVHDTDVVSEAQIWMMRAYAEMGWFSDAENLASTLRVRKLPKDLHHTFTEFYAFLLLRREDYRGALPFLAQTVKNEKNGPRKRRLQFLLGQVYTRLGERENAYNAFEQIKKLSTPYDEVFQALMAQAQVTLDGGAVIGRLRKMAGNKKNREHLDRIYTAIGTVYLSQGDTGKAVENYLLAEEKSVKNGVDKALAQAALGDIYFHRQEFMKAEPRYSQALGALPRSNENYARVASRAEVLSELVPLLVALEEQDSLRREEREEVYYRLHRIYLGTGNRAMAQRFGNNLIAEFPESEYAAILTDPDYEYVMRHYVRIQDSLYQETYRAYRQGRSETVRKNFERAQKLFFNGHLMPKFMLLNALSLAQSGNAGQLETALQELASKHPDTEESALAQQILAGLSEGKILAVNASALSGIDWGREIASSREESTADSVLFRFQKDLPHSYLLLFLPGSLRKNELLFAVSDFNFSNFRIRAFHADYIRVPPYEALQIQPFHSFDEALRYAAMIAADTVFRQTVPAGIVPLVISDENLKLLQNGESFAEYRMFFAADSIPPIVPIKQPEWTVETEKTVSLEPEKTDQPDIAPTETQLKQPKLLPDEQPSTGVLSKKERERILKEREDSRKAWIKQRERELKQREKARKEELKRRERERKQKLKEQERLRKEKLKQRQ